MQLNLKITINSYFFSNLSHITLNWEPTDDNHAVSKSSVGSLSENDRNRRDMSIVFNDQYIEFDINKLTILDSITVNLNPTSDNDPSN